jgi:hypothetical protein
MVAEIYQDWLIQLIQKKKRLLWHKKTLAYRPRDTTSIRGARVLILKKA